MKTSDDGQSREALMGRPTLPREVRFLPTQASDSLRIGAYKIIICHQISLDLPESPGQPIGWLYTRVPVMRSSITIAPSLESRWAGPLKSVTSFFGLRGFLTPNHFLGRGVRTRGFALASRPRVRVQSSKGYRRRVGPEYRSPFALEEAVGLN